MSTSATHKALGNAVQTKAPIAGFGQYFPKETDLSHHSQAHLNKIARQLNERPRKTFQFETPTEKFDQCVAMTG
tara:strand:- start:131280 stop:131501 length:222 start_codon:yes stop_codon:yes gene_type:complete